MKTRTRLVLLALALGALTGPFWAPKLAQAAETAGLDRTPRYMFAGFYSGTTVPAGNRVTSMLAGSVDYDFPAIGAASDYAGCRDSFGFAVTGAKVGDPCMLGYLNPTPFDGGATGQNFVASCSVVATGVIAIRGCCMPGDGGSCNVDDAGYSYRIISNQ